MIGELRLIEKYKVVWSITNQMNIKLMEDVVVKITHTCLGNDIIFVKPQQILFNMLGFIPTIIERGTDEWSIDLKNTKPYTLETKLKI